MFALAGERLFGSGADGMGWTGRVVTESVEQKDGALLGDALATVLNDREAA